MNHYLKRKSQEGARPTIIRKESPKDKGRGPEGERERMANSGFPIIDNDWWRLDQESTKEKGRGRGPTDHLLVLEGREMAKGEREVEGLVGR